MNLEQFAREMEEILRDFPEMRREMHKKAAVRLQREVRIQIATKLNDEDGTVQDWQDVSIGSGGGYAKIKAKKGRIGADSPGAITNYLENGHKARKPMKSQGERGLWANKRTARSRAYVSGRGFYHQARKQAATVLQQEAQNLMEEVRRRLCG